MSGELRDRSSTSRLVPHPGFAPEDRPAAPVADEFGDAFVGRAEELSRLGAVLEDVRCGCPQVVLVEGAAGIGKTALVERFLLAESDLQVLRCAGEPWEGVVGFGVIDQLFRGSGMTSARLLAVPGSGLPYFEPVTVGAQILTLLSEQEAKGPVVLLVDDLQWADCESLRALLFAMRRLATQRVLTLLVTRDATSTPTQGLCRLAARHGGAVLRLPPLTERDVRSLASCMIGRAVSTGVTARLHAHTQGNPSYVRAVLAELPAQHWCSLEHVLPAPRPVSRWVCQVVDMCSPACRRLVEAASILGDGGRVMTVAALAGVEDPLTALEEASAVGLLMLRDEPSGRQVVFPHPLVQTAVYEQLGPVRRVRLHSAAAELVDEEGPRLRHRVAAADPPDDGLAAELSGFAERQASTGEWAAAAAALHEASRMSGPEWLREQRRLLAVDLLAGTGELGHVRAPAMDASCVATIPLRDALLGHLAILRGRPQEAEALLDSAWERCDRSGDRFTAALVAQRLALHSLGRLRPSAAVDWARRATALAPAAGSAPMTSDGLLALGLGWSGRVPEGLAVRASASGDDSESVSSLPLRIAFGALRIAGDDVTTARVELSGAVRAEQRVGWIAHRVWAYVWLSRAEFLAGAWDDSVLTAARAVALLEETQHGWLRPLARWAAVAVPAARGEWRAAQEHARLASAQGGDYELMVVAAGLARAQLAAAQGDHEEVLRALEPVLEIQPREGVDEPGFWPWQGLYGDALVTAGRLEEAEAFLVPHEELAAARGRRSSVAMLVRVRGRLEAAAGRAQAAEAAFQRGLAQFAGLSVPFPQALLELAYGQVLRRHGRRRVAAEQLQAARDRFAALGARPYVEVCERELSASGLAPAKRHDFDPSRLTAQEFAVAQLVIRGLSNRQVASELFVSVKTVQFHLTRIYSKLRVSSRAELAATYQDVGEAQPSSPRTRDGEVPSP